MFQASQVTMILGKPRIYVNGGSEIAQKGRGACNLVPRGRDPFG